MAIGLIGRAADERHLDGLLETVSRGTGGVAFLEGEAGIGKSALLEVCLEKARARGFTVFNARAEELERDRPFRASWLALGAGSGTRRARLAELLVASDPTTFYRVIDAFDDLVESEALRSPTVLAIDDLQWADEGTIQALASIVRLAEHLPVVVLATMRPVPRGRALAALLRSASADAIVALVPLEGSAVDELAHARLGAVAGPRLRALLEAAGGNPFFVIEVLEALRADSSLRFELDHVELERDTLPPSLIVTIMRRLSGLTEGAREAVRMASVLGRSFSLDELAIAANLTLQEASAAVRTVRDHGVFDDVDERLGFRHDLIREAVYADMGAAAQASAHRRIGLALTAAGADPLDVSEHLARGATKGDREAVDIMLRAAEDPRIDSRTASTLIERALEVDPDHERRASLARRLSGLLLWQGRAREALPHLQRLFAAEADPSERLTILQLLVSAHVSLGRGAEVSAFSAQAKALASALVDDERPEVLLSVAQAMFLSHDHEGALTVAERVVTLTRGRGDGLEREANNKASWLATSLYRSPLAVERSARAVELPAPVGIGAVYWRHRAWALGDMDRIDEAEAALSLARRLAEDAGHPPTVMSILSESAHLGYTLGRWPEAVTDAETALSIASEYGGGDGSDNLALLAWIHHRRGEVEHLQRLERGLAADNWDAILRWTLRSVLAAERGELEDARALAAACIERLGGVGIRGRRDVDMLPTLARVAMLTGDHELGIQARNTAIVLDESSGAPGPALVAVRVRAIVDGDRAAAERAIEHARSSPRALHAAETFEDCAEAMGDRAVELLTEAERLYASFGAQRDRERVAGLLRARGVRRRRTQPADPRPVSGWDALTPAELEVVKLAAAGLTNREVGARLFVSHRTVSTHLSHVFDKLGIRSRVELAREASHRLEAGDASRPGG